MTTARRRAAAATVTQFSLDPRGAKPADLPVEQSSRLEFVVDLATAKTLGLKIPREILLQADQVID